MTEGTDGTDDESSVNQSCGATTEPEAIAAVGAYEEGEDVVLYDTENPLAWVQARTAIDIAEMV